MEYTLILGIVVLVFTTLNPMIKRLIQGMIKSAADQIGTQQNAEQEFNEEKGYVVSSSTAVNSRTNKLTKEGRMAGSTDIEYNDVVSIGTSTTSILGFTENKL